MSSETLRLVSSIDSIGDREFSRAELRIVERDGLRIPRLLESDRQTYASVRKMPKKYTVPQVARAEVIAHTRTSRDKRIGMMQLFEETATMIIAAGLGIYLIFKGAMWVGLSAFF